MTKAFEKRQQQNYAHELRDANVKITDKGKASRGISRRFRKQDPRHGGAATVSRSTQSYDAAGNKGASATVTVQVSNNSTVSGGSLTFSGSATSQGSTWSAAVKVTGAAAGALISGAWNIGGTPSSCTADSAGACTITRTGIRKNVSSVTWTHGATGQKVAIAKP